MSSPVDNVFATLDSTMTMTAFILQICPLFFNKFHISYNMQMTFAQFIKLVY